MFASDSERMCVRANNKTVCSPEILVPKISMPLFGYLGDANATPNHIVVWHQFGQFDAGGASVSTRANDSEQPTLNRSGRIS